MPRFMTTESEGLLHSAIAEVERQSSAEIVVVVRPRSASYRHIDLSLGMIAAFAVLAFLLYSPWPFGLHYFLIHSAIAAIGVTLLSSLVPALQRGLSKTGTMDKAVQRAAKAAFVSAGAHHTQYRSGLVVYVSLLERSIALVADSGVALVFPQEEWKELQAQANALMARGGQASELAELIAQSAPAFAKYLPSTDEDSNELPNVVVQ